jgi:hypothetical protein
LRSHSRRFPARHGCVDGELRDVAAQLADADGDELGTEPDDLDGCV